MNWNVRITALAATALLLAGTTGCKQLAARDQLNKGTQAYKAAQYEEAINHFERSIALDPTYPMARLYLATAQSQQVIPNVDTPDNLKLAHDAINNFKLVIQRDPRDLTALKQIASINFNIRNFDEAKSWQKQVLQVNPRDAEADYTIGVIDWTQAYRNAVTILAADGIKDDGEGNAKKSKDDCKKITDQNTDLVKDGLGFLQNAVDINPNYEDAMAYINLLYRRKADMECGNENARKADIDAAKKWTDRAMGARKFNEEKRNNAQPGGVDLGS